MRLSNHTAPLLAATTILLWSQAAQAQVSPADAKCRSAFDKVLGKYNATVHKTIAGCWKDVFTGKLPTSASCNSVAFADAQRQKVAKAALRLAATIGGGKSKCVSPTNDLALAEFSSNGCPSPATGPIASWSDASACALAITNFQAEQLWRYTFAPTESAVAIIKADSALSKCAATMRKAAIKLSKTAAKERGKAQQVSDKSGGSYDFTAGNLVSDKIDAATAKLVEGIAKDCSALQTSQVASTASCRADVAGLQACLPGPWIRNGSGQASMAYEQAGVCPTTILVAVNAGTGGGARLNATNLDLGWTGFAHGIEIPDGLEGSIAVDCSASSNDGSACDACTPALRCAATGANCRCSNDSTALCDTPNGPDADDCGGNTCIVHLGPPLPINPANSPTCVVNTAAADLTSAAPIDIGAGTSATALSMRTKVFHGLAQTRPCPKCEGDTVPNDGIKDGTCNGGDNDGGACDANGIYATFGETSYDCQPSAGLNVSGFGLIVGLTLSDGPASLAEGTDCGIGAGYRCACRVCSNDPTKACNSDLECAPGTCSDDGTGATSFPNVCSDLVCTLGECTSASSQIRFCDGHLAGDGSGVLSCGTNADCSTFDSECGDGCGNCTLSEPLPCFTSGTGTETIDVAGAPGTDGGVLASAFCVPPTGNAGTNAAFGWPGPATVALDARFTAQCANGTAWQFPGGSNCQ